MQIISAEQIQLQLSDIDAFIDHPYKKVKRAKGVHLSGVLKPMAEAFNLLKDIDPADFEEEFPLRMVIGLAVERQIAGLYKNLVWQPPPIRRDGIVGSPDGFLYPRPVEDLDQVLRIWEHKYTHKSCRDFDIRANKNKLWIWQVMSYCAMEGLNEAELHIVFGNGDYNRPFKEQYWKFVLGFDTVELEKHWQMVLKFKNKAKPE